MIPKQSLTPYPEFGNNATKVKPDDPKYAAGFEPADVLPAEWLNWFLNRSSKGVTELGDGVDSMESELISVLTAGSQTPDQSKTNQLLLAIQAIINAVRLDEQQRPAVGVPTLWLGSKPDWALDFGNGATDKYLWSNYPKLNNDKFKDILSTLSTAGWMTAYDTSGFYVPDLRGIVPVGYGISVVRAGETTSGGTVGQYLESQNKYHDHGVTKGGYNGSGFTGNAITGSVERNSSSLIEPLANTTGWSSSGALYPINKSTSRSYQVESSSSSRLVGIGFSATPTGTVSVTVNAAGTSGQASKPPTIGCMWIVRFN